MKKYLAVFLLVACALCAQAQVKLASLHPLLSEMARAVGGESVEVVDLFPENVELHEFSPQPAAVAAASGASFVMACGKGVEPYLDGLRATCRIVELGADVPDVQLPDGKGYDPHWWNSPANMKRAAATLLAELQKADAAQAATYRAGYAKYAAEMDKLDREARLAFSRIPAESRVLVTEHAAMCHFCAQYGFKAIPVYGIAKEAQGDPASMANMLAQLRESKVRCIFREWTGTPRPLEGLAKQIGAEIRPLVLDGICPDMKGYAATFRANVQNITEGLAPQAKQ